MKELKTIRFILHCFRAFGFYPFDIAYGSSRNLYLKPNVIWYIYSTLVTLIMLSNMIQVTVQPYWDVSQFHALVSYSRLIMVSLDAVVCYAETLCNVQWHIEFFETIAQLDKVLRKFQLELSCKRLRFWVPMSALMLLSFNVIPQFIFIYDRWNINSIGRLLITLQFEIPNLLASVKSLQMIFYAFIIFAQLDVLENVRKSYDSGHYRITHLTMNDFNQYHDHITNLIDIFNKCFGWSIIVNVTRDFIFFGEGSYLMIFSEKSMLVVLIWSHIVYCVLFCWVCHLTNRKATELRVTGLQIEKKLIKSRTSRTTFNNFSSLKAQHHHGYAFKAFGCFVIDLKLLFGFFVFLTNYLLTCIQFAMVDEPDNFRPQLEN